MVRSVRCGWFVIVVIIASSIAQRAAALPRTWIGGSVDWVETSGVDSNWSPNVDLNEPDAADEAIFNTGNAVNLGTNNSIQALTMSGGIDLLTNDFDLTVDGLVQLTGASTNLIIGGAAGSINADDLTINSGGTVELRGGLLTMDEEAGTSLIDINAGGVLQGNGTISFADNPGVATTMLVNDGTLTALSRGLTIFSPPPVGTLTISDAGLNGRLDLDGSGEAGVVNVNRNQTLATEMQLFDTFNGTLNLFHNSTFQFNPTFSLGTGGSLIVNNGFVAGGLGFSDIPADTSYIESAEIDMTGGTINVVDTDGTLQIDALFTMSGGSFTNSGTVIFNNVTSITTAAGYAPSSINAQTIVNANVTITDVAGNFNWDGNGAADTTVNGTAVLSITANQVDTGDNIFGGTLTLNDNADASVNVAATSWTVAGNIIKNNAGTSTISGDRIVLEGGIDVNQGTLDLPSFTSTNTSIINVAGLVTLGTATEFGGAGSIAGAGTLRMEGTSTVLAHTAVSVGTFDWDGLGAGTSHTINPGVTFTVNSAALDTDGDMDDPFTLAGNLSQLIVNNTNGLTQWTMNGIVTGNASAAGTATIGGTSRMILAGTMNVDGNTTISAPLTYNAGSTASVDLGMTLNATNNVTHAGGTITGLGTYSPGLTNTVTGNTSITAATFDFDAGTWTVDPGAALTVNVTDYDTTVTNAFDGVITLHGGVVDVNTADAEFVMDGTLNMQSEPGNLASWEGEPVDIGNDAGALDADLNVTGVGTGTTQFVASVDFNSDADVNVAAGRLLFFATSSTVNFDTVNGVNNAEFTGSGSISFNGAVNVNEAVTLNMVGGTVDLDGTDPVGEFINIDAPFTINAATMSSFGKVNLGGINTLDINNNVGTGVLTVNLDNANSEWTLNGPGVMYLVNDNVEATLLAGSDININGTVNVTGDVRTTARLDIAGVVNINTAGQPLRLSGGTVLTDPNTLAGGTITGLGQLGADSGSSLHGFGTISTDISFSGTANLRASGGTLTVNGDILLANIVGTADETGTLNIPAAWNNNVTAAIAMLGGMLQGGTITNDAGNGIQGFGTVTSRVINNTQLLGGNGGGTLIFQTAGNDNDWDGAANSGELIANAAATLELRDNATFGFTGSVTASPGGTVFTNGFGLDFNPGSSIQLASGKLQSTHSTNVGGMVTVNAGPESTIEVTNNFFLTFESTSSTTLGGNLRLKNNNIGIDAGAAISGAGALIVPDGSHLVADNLANIGVLLDMQGAFRPGNSEGIGRIDLLDYQQANSGELFTEIAGTALNAFDRLVASGDVVLDGYLNIDIDGGFVPSLGQTFNVITGNTVTGTFDHADVSGMPAGLAFHIAYLGNAVQLQVVNKPIFSADFDDDGDVDATDYAIWRGAFNLNHLGDANGDNQSNAADYVLWRDQFGSVPGAGAGVGTNVAVPEPTALAFVAVAALCVIPRRHRRIVFSVSV